MPAPAGPSLTLAWPAPGARGSYFVAGQANWMSGCPAAIPGGEIDAPLTVTKITPGFPSRTHTGPFMFRV